MSEPLKNMATRLPGHQITSSMTVVFYQQSRERIRTLGPGVILIPISDVDRRGMLHATYDGHLVRVFQRDLTEKSQPIELEAEVVRTTQPSLRDLPPLVVPNSRPSHRGLERLR